MGKMKLHPDNNFYCKVKNYKYEILESTRDFFDDIYLVTLGEDLPTSIAVVPYFDKTLIELLPKLPDDIKEFTSRLDARLYVLEVHHNIITPNDGLAGTVEQMEILTLPEFPRRTSIFYIGDDDYCKYCTEFSEIHDIEDTRYGATVDKLAHFHFIKFLKEMVIPSPYFQ
jgi:hypothetical protein